MIQRILLCALVATLPSCGLYSKLNDAVDRVDLATAKADQALVGIEQGLATMGEISDVVVDHEHKLVSFSGDQSVRDAVVNKLRSMGYPEKDSLSGIDAGLATAKSFVSCAIGRVS